MVELQKADTTGTMAKEIEMIRTLVSQGQAFVAADKLDDIDPLLERAGAFELYIRAVLNRMEATAAAEAAEAQAVEAEKLAQESKAQADATEARFNELEAAGL